MDEKLLWCEFSRFMPEVFICLSRISNLYSFFFLCTGPY